MTKPERNPEEEMLLSFMELMVDGLSQTFGSRCEIVLHDLSKGEQSIVKISNSDVSGRTDFASIDRFKLDVLCNHSENGTQINYPSVSDTGKYLKSTSLLIRGRKDDPMAVFCINIDMSDFLGIHRSLQDMFGISKGDSDAQPLTSGGIAGKTVDLVVETIRELGKPVKSFSQKERLQVVHKLYQRRFFLTKGSVKLLASKLMVSKSTIYNYLEKIKGQ